MMEVVDSLLATWTERQKRMDDNLIALEGDPTYSELVAKKDRLTGVTRERVLPALEAVTQLFEQREQLNSVIARAKDMRDSASFWDRAEKARGVMELLNGPSIDLGVAVAPLAKRSLLDAGEQRLAMTPDELLEEMVKAYERARDVLTDVANALAAVAPALGDLDAQIAAMREAARVLGNAPAELVDVEHDFAAIQKELSFDPLGARGNVGAHLVPRLKAAQAKIAAERAARDGAEHLLHQARQEAASLARLHDDTCTAVERAKKEIAGTWIPRGLEQGEIEGLTEWLAKIERAASAGRWSAVEVGARRWLESAAQQRGLEEIAITAANGALAEREELIGRLSAREAQAQALLVRGRTIDATTLDRARLAHRLLAERPARVAEARREIEAFEAAVVALGRKP